MRVNPCLDHLDTVNVIGGDAMTKIISKLIKLIFKSLKKEKQPTVKAENSLIILININKD